MKNSNLLNRLLSYSHEKQSPQRFARYAAILIMLLTLGVEQVWATDGQRAVVYAVCTDSELSAQSAKTIKLGKKDDTNLDWSDLETVLKKSTTEQTFYWDNKRLFVFDFTPTYDGLKMCKPSMFDGSTEKYRKNSFSNWNWIAESEYRYKLYTWGDGCADCNSRDGWSNPYDNKMTMAAGHVYFDATDWMNETYIQLTVGHMTHQGYYTMTRVPNTNLYYVNFSGGWSDALHMGFVGNSSTLSTGDQTLYTTVNANKYTGGIKWGLQSGHTNLFTHGANNGDMPANAHDANSSTYSFLNSTQTIESWVDDGSGYSKANSKADISIQTYEITGHGATTERTETLSTSENSQTITACRRATTTLSVGDVAAMYLFVGWYDDSDNELSTATTYTYYPTGATTVRAKFVYEPSNQVAVTYICTETSGTVKAAENPYVGTLTPSTFTAGTPYGFTFTSWTVGDGLDITDGDESSNSISVTTKASGTYTLRANYSQVLTTDWKLIGDNGTNSPFGDAYSYASGKEMSKKSGYSANYDAYKTLDITHTGTWGFKVATAAGSSYEWGYGQNSDYITYNRSYSGSAGQVYTGNEHELKFNPDALGEYEFKVDYTSGTYVTVTFPTAYTVTFGKGTGGSNVVAKYNTVSFNSGTKVQSGKTVTFTQTASTGYQFKEWNTNSSGGGTRLSTDATYNHTVASTNNVYAIYDPKQYAITLNDQDATTAVSPSSVNATYKSLTLSSAITNPLKSGYTFGGWYSAAGGGGSLIINTSGALQASKDGYTDATGWTKTSAATVYAKWTQVLTLDKNGGTTDGVLTVIYKKSATSSHTAATRTGYTLAGYYDATSGGNKIINADGSLVSYSASVSSYIKTDGSWGYNGTPTLYAQWTANSYDVTLKPNGATTGSDQVVRATFDASMPTSTKTSVALVAPTKTGYTLQGFYQNSDGTGTKYYNANMTSANNWDQASTTNIWAIWQANGYTVTLDIDEDNKGTIAGADESASVTFDDAPTTIANRPTAANGYALDGYYTDHLGEGTKVINGDGTWIAEVLGYTVEDAKWVYAGNLTLYAYYKKAEITELVASPGVIAPGETITVTPTISPTPTGTTKVCWEVQYSNGTPLPSQPTFTPGVGNAVSFPVPSASATYIIQATLAKGSSCPADPEDVLSTRTTTFQVAGEHDVTVLYKDAEGNTIKASEVIENVDPLEWSGNITAPTITGYTFTKWQQGDGVTINGADGNGEKASATIQIKATYDGTLTAVYNKKNMIFFNNTLGWEDVYVYFYNTNEYWSGDYGSGALQTQQFNGDHKPYWEQEHGHMTQIEGTNIWYFDYTATGYSTRANVAFTEGSQHGRQWFWKTKAVVRGDHKSSLPMYVPINAKTTTKNETDYYNDGYWMNYPENTGYVLHVYDGTTYGQSDQLQQIPFEFTADKTLPMSINVELNAGKTYGFEIHRADGTVLGENSYTLESGDSGDEGQTVKTLGESERSKITTVVAGDYKFTLNYGYSGSYTYLIGVHYPVVTGDYRILYTDDATWSKDAHSANYAWWHESRTIHKENGATDIVSFYVKKDNDTKMKFQKVSGINASTGAVTWADSTSGSINLSSISADGVYNFYLSQANGVITVDSIRPYTGNYYIRTDCAGATRWENFRTTDHQMTYSDYAEEYSGYSHYYAHWVEQYTNIKFVIANDYSPCISDTLAADYGTTIANITTSGDEAGKLNSASANIRFMWNQATNKISRAYIGGSSNISDRFLVLEGDTRMFDEDGDTLTTAGGGKISGLNDYEMNLVDAQNFVYERTIKVNTGAKAKLTAKYNNNIQYFKGGPGTTSADSVELLGGESSTTKHTMRIVYDFKTNRLMTAFVPSDTIKNALAINADLMIVREHQEAGHQLLFNGGSLSKVHTVYGVMRFNRWTLNNKEKTGGHSVVGDPKSAYERGLYWISFPFDVKLSDVFGFGTYGTHWIIMEYDGAERAQKGYWADSEGFWKYVWPSQRSTYELKAGKGYVLALDLDLMKDNNSSFWSNNIEQVELFFPSAKEVENIESTNVTTTVASHLCTIDRTNSGGTDINKNRTKADSHWNIIGIPSYANYGSTLKDGSGNIITWNTEPYTNDLPFLYEWSTVDNSYAVQSGTTYPFKSMHAYMVQYAGDLYWSLASATPPSIVARSTYVEKPESVEMRLELQQNEMKVDQTFVKLSNDENASANFAFDEDLCKEFNANKANIYTIVENYLPVAGNTMPMSEQTTVIPVGVRIAADGDYTFAIPDGTEGIGVTLIDNETGIRTSLTALEYTINLSAGDYADRFVLEISPISQISTDVESISDEGLEIRGARKIMIDGLLYIVKDGKLFDAQGKRVQ